MGFCESHVIPYRSRHIYANSVRGIIIFYILKYAEWDTQWMKTKKVTFIQLEFELEIALCSAPVNLECIAWIKIYEELFSIGKHVKLSSLSLSIYIYIYIYVCVCVCVCVCGFIHWRRHKRQTVRKRWKTSFDLRPLSGETFLITI